MNRKLIFGGIVLLVLILLVGGGFLFLNNRNNQSTSEDLIPEFEENYPELSPEEIGLVLDVRSDGRAVMFTINNASDFQSVEYDLSYEADLSGAEAAESGTGRIQRGVTGEDTVSGDVYESKFLDLGSCSSGKCRYDSGVEEVTIVLKLTKKDGSIFQVTDSITL